MGIMKDKLIHIRVPEEVLKKFKIHCIENDLSMPKMISQILTSFCENMDQNKGHIQIKEK